MFWGFFAASYSPEIIINVFWSAEVVKDKRS